MNQQPPGDWQGIPDSEPTWNLKRFRAAMDSDDNMWWRTASGHHLNLFESACEMIDELESKLTAVQMECHVEIQSPTKSAHFPERILALAHLAGTEFEDPEHD